jgi:hypothetical protein
LIATQGRLFFLTSETCIVIARLCLLFPTPLTLSPQKATPVPTSTLALSPQKVTRSISLLRSPRRPALFTASSYARSWRSLSSESRCYSRPAGRVRDGERGQRTSTAASSKADTSVSPPPRARHRPVCYRRDRDAASDPPPRPCSPRRKSSSRWKLIAPFYLVKFFSCPNPLMLSVFCDELYSFGVWNADGGCCSCLDVQTALRILGEFLKQGQWFSKSSGGGYEKSWCSANALPLCRLSQLEEIRTTGNHYSSFGHTWFHKKLHVLE